MGCCGPTCGPVVPGGGGGSPDAGTDVVQPPPPSTSWILALPYTETTVGEPGFTFHITAEIRPGGSIGQPFAIVPLGYIYFGTTEPMEIDGIDAAGAVASRTPLSGTASPIVDEDGAGAMDALQPPGSAAVNTFDAVIGEKGQAAWFSIDRGTVAKTTVLSLVTKPAYVDIEATDVSMHPWFASGVQEVTIGTEAPGTLWYFSVGGTTVRKLGGPIEFAALSPPLGEFSGPKGIVTGNDDVWVVTETPNRFARFTQPTLSVRSNDRLEQPPFGLDIAKTDRGVTEFVVVGTQKEGLLSARVLAYPGGVTSPSAAIQFELPDSMGTPVDLAASMIGDLAYAWVATQSPNSIVRLTIRGTRIDSAIVTNLGSYRPIQIKIADAPVPAEDAGEPGRNAGSVTILAREP
jgi:hypothetical protein